MNTTSPEASKSLDSKPTPQETLKRISPILQELLNDPNVDGEQLVAEVSAIRDRLLNVEDPIDKAYRMTTGSSRHETPRTLRTGLEKLLPYTIRSTDEALENCWTSDEISAAMLALGIEKSPFTRDSILEMHRSGEVQSFDSQPMTEAERNPKNPSQMREVPNPERVCMILSDGQLTQFRVRDGAAIFNLIA